MLVRYLLVRGGGSGGGGGGYGGVIELTSDWGHDHRDSECDRSRDSLEQRSLRR